MPSTPNEIITSLYHTEFLVEKYFDLTMGMTMQNASESGESGQMDFMDVAKA